VADASVTHHRGRPGSSIVVCAAVEAHGVKGGSLVVIADARRDGQLLPCNDCNAVWPGSYVENALRRLQAARVDPSHADGPAVGHQHHPAIRDDTGSFRKVRQGRDVLAGIVVDDLDAVPAGVRHEHPAGRRIERAVVERTAGGVGYRNGRDCLQRHDHRAFCFAVSRRHHV